LDRSSVLAKLDMKEMANHALTWMNVLKIRAKKIHPVATLLAHSIALAIQALLTKTEFVKT